MLTVDSQNVIQRSALQAATRKYWVIEAADYLVERGIYRIEELPWAMVHAKRLASRHTDESGEILESPKQAVDDDLSYEPS